MRIVGMDIHRVFAEAVMLDGERVIRLGRIGMTRDHLGKFARTLTHDDHVVIEATGNATAVAEVMAPHVGRVVIANPKQVRMIAHAKIKTDAIDATVLARLYASGFLPEVWVPDAHTAALRREVTRRGADRTAADAAEDYNPLHPARASAAAMPAYRPVRQPRQGLADGTAAPVGRKRGCRTAPARV